MVLELELFQHGVGTGHVMVHNLTLAITLIPPPRADVSVQQHMLWVPDGCGLDSGELRLKAESGV